MRLLLPLIVLAALVGCADERAPVRTDPAPLIKRVELPAGIGAVRWRVKTVPENKPRDLVPGPVDYDIIYAFVALGAASGLPRLGPGTLELPADVVDILPASAPGPVVAGELVKLTARLPDVVDTEAVAIPGGLVVKITIDRNVAAGS